MPGLPVSNLGLWGKANVASTEYATVHGNTKRKPAGEASACHLRVRLPFAGGAHPVQPRRCMHLSLLRLSPSWHPPPLGHSPQALTEHALESSSSPPRTASCGAPIELIPHSALRPPDRAGRRSSFSGLIYREVEASHILLSLHKGTLMSPKILSSMELECDFDDEDVSSKNGLQELWPLGEIDPKKARFPCCIVWTPLPVVSWLAPYIGHVGICQEDGAVMDFAGSNLVSVDNFAYGSVARYLQLDRKKCCFPVNLAAHVCGQSYIHSEVGAAISWDDALQSGMRRFQHKFYNLFTCNCHSFVANCLNRIAYKGSVEWNVLNVAALVWFHGQWVDKMSVIRSFLPFLTVTCIGILMAGWSFLIGMAAFSALLIGWFIFTVYCFKGFVC